MPKKADNKKTVAEPKNAKSPSKAAKNRSKAVDKKADKAVATRSAKDAERIAKLEAKLAKQQQKLVETQEKLQALGAAPAVPAPASAAADSAAPAAPAKKAKLAVSPLAPARFPDLPPVAGVSMAAVEANVRYKGRLDVALFSIEGKKGGAAPAIAGTFTRSLTRAAPVLWCEEQIAAAAKAARPASRIGILVNAGNANAFTGDAGRQGVETTAKAAAKAMGSPRMPIYVSSTGVIGEPLPAERIVAKLEELNGSLAEGAWESAERAIMTTDTFPKGASAEAMIGETPIKVVGIAKGSGMIAPDMATMLVYVFTDAAVDQKALQRLTSEICDRTFNAITVDGDTSTSDTLLVGASGHAGNAPIVNGRSAGYAELRDSLESVFLSLAQQVVRDGEGATKFVELRISGAKTPRAARKIGLAIANSPLVKTAWAGEDPNWGRIVMAVGKSGEEADRDTLSIRYGEHPVAEKGWRAADYDEETLAAYMKGQDLVVSVDVGVGSGEATVWTCDLTHGYISINADYRS